MLFKRKIYTPKGKAFVPYMNALNEKHLLIAGTTGSGKSVLVNGLIYTALYSLPSEKSFIFIDPKRVELSMYKGLQHCIAYASEPNDMVNALQKAMNITEDRYKVMQRKGLKTSTEGHIYVVIDEYADLINLLGKKTIEPLIQRLSQIGRAANIHLWVCTQSPISSIITTPIKCCLDSRFALRTRSAQDSRNILGKTGCELLPKYGQAYYMTADGIVKIKVPYYSDNELQERVRFWTSQRCWLGLLTA